MENPYQPPETLVSSEPRQLPESQYASLGAAAFAGAKMAIRWVTVIVVPISVLLYVLLWLVLIYRALVEGVWPEYDAPQFWFSMAFVAMALIVLYLFICFLVGLYTTLFYSVRYLYQQKPQSNNAD